MHSVEHIFKQYYARLCVYATSLLGDPDSAEDAVQTVFLNLINQADQELDEIGLPYLYRAVKNTALNILRKQAYHIAYLEKDAPELIENGYDEEIIRAELTSRLERILDDLPPGCNQILRLSYIEGLKHKEIAEKLQISINTVKSQKMRAINLLKEKVSTKYLLILLFFLKNF